MMDEGSACGEPDVGAIDLSSRSSGRTGRAHRGEHFNIPLPLSPPYSHRKHFKLADDSLAPVAAWALVEIFHCLLSTMSASFPPAEVFFIDPPVKWHPLV